MRGAFISSFKHLSPFIGECMREFLNILKLFLLGALSLFSKKYGKTKEQNKQLKRRVREDEKLNKIRKRTASMSYDELCERLFDAD